MSSGTLLLLLLVGVPLVMMFMHRGGHAGGGMGGCCGGHSHSDSAKDEAQPEDRTDAEKTARS
jgi:hypothetical protein